MNNEASDQRRITFPPHVGRAVVKGVEQTVGKMLASSRLIDRQLNKNDAKMGLFDIDEVRLGKLVGSGSFSDVYEVTGFQPNHDGDKSYSNYIKAARKHCEENAIMNGTSKYVVKHLKLATARNPSQFCLAATDLCVEAQFLSSLKHDNILQIRGWSAGGLKGFESGNSDGYFLLLDRLSETLGERIDRWREEKRNQSLEYTLNKELTLDGSGNNSQLLSRTRVAHQVASALEYLHAKNIVFRDLKPDNVGFDEFGAVKIFDFGLTRELPKECANVNDVYKMSGKIGTLRYMAPEVALCQPYNQKVDTYSWAMLYWACLTLEKPYEGMTREVHTSLVSRLGQRPQLKDEWPSSVQRLLKRAWAPDAFIRATITEVCAYLERIEKELSGELQYQAGGNLVELSRSSFTRQGSNSILTPAA